MREIDIINKFSNGELENGQTFIFEVKSNEPMRLKRVRLKVNEYGTCLTCSWLDYKNNIICNQWTLWKNNLTGGGYVKI